MSSIPTFSFPFLNSWILISSSCFIIFLTTFLLIIKKQVNSKYKNLKLPPGSYGWPILGESLEFISHRNNGCPDRFVKERMAKYDTTVFKTSLLGETMVILCGASGNKFLFSNEYKLVATWWPTSVKKLLGQSLVNHSGAQGLQMRKMISYYLNPDAFTKLYIKTIDVVTQQHIKAHWQGKEAVTVYPTIKMYTFELACRLFMSIEETKQIEKLATLFYIFTGGVISIPLNFPGTRFYKAAKATIAIKKELHTIVQQRKVALETKTCTSKDLLSHLLVTPDENGKFMSDSAIVDNILLFLFAGHDTTSSAMTMLMNALAEHPDVYAKVLNEQNEIASSKEAGEFLNWDDIKKMKYSWCVVSETLRLWPPIVGSFREAITDISYKGYDIPKGWKFYWNSQLTHHDSRLYENPDKFDPSRFEEDNNNTIPYSYVAFGGGPRMCPGKEFARLEILIFLHNVVRSFKWSLAIPNGKLNWDPLVVPEKGLPIFLHPNKNTVDTI